MPPIHMTRRPFYSRNLSRTDDIPECCLKCNPPGSTTSRDATLYASVASEQPSGIYAGCSESADVMWKNDMPKLRCPKHERGLRDRKSANETCSGNFPTPGTSYNPKGHTSDAKSIDFGQSHAMSLKYRAR